MGGGWALEAGVAGGGAAPGVRADDGHLVVLEHLDANLFLGKCRCASLRDRERRFRVYKEAPGFGHGPRAAFLLFK